VKKSSGELKLLAPMAMIVIVAVCALVGSLWIWAEQADRMSRTREEALVRIGLEQIADSHAQLMTPITIWGAAVTGTAVKYDPKWVANNIGAYFHDFLGFDTSLLLDDQDRLRAAFYKGQPVDLAAQSALKAQAEPLVKALRQTYERRRRQGLS
jgi:sensor domain CHASE-containing protein